MDLVANFLQTNSENFFFSILSSLGKYQLIVIPAEW